MTPLDDAVRRGDLLSLEEVLAERADYRRRVEAKGKAGTKAELDICNEDIVHWLTHWPWTFDPRLSGLKTRPFTPWLKQIAFMHWLEERERLRKPGLCEKSRDS